MDAIAMIFARAGSKGLPGKNIKLLGGTPLIGWSIQQAKSVKRIRRVIVSTDSLEIAAVAREFGAETPFIRPENLACDNTPEWLAWRHALEYIMNEEGKLPDVMVSVPATAPLRLPLDIENALDAYEKGGVDTVITVTEAHRNPYFNMVKESTDGTVVLVNQLSDQITRRQDAPKIYDMTTVCYVVNSEFVINHNGLFEGKIRAIQVPAERAIDIDTSLDFRIAEFLIEKKQIS